MDGAGHGFEHCYPHQRSLGCPHGGATLPAMSNSGSGNQGITATMPVVVVAEHVQADDERLARALMLSHLSAIYIHYQLPRLSALCAATTAGMGLRRGWRG